MGVAAGTVGGLGMMRRVAGLITRGGGEAAVILDCATAMKPGWSVWGVRQATRGGPGVWSDGEWGNDR